MERREPAVHEARLRRAREAEEAPTPPATAARDETNHDPATDEQVTPYDHLWFDRRPLS